MRPTRALCAPLLFCLAFTGCERSEEAPRGATASADTIQTSVTLKPTDIEALTARVSAVTSGCKLTRENVPRSCTGEQLRSLTALVRERKLELYPEVVELLGSPDLPTQRVAAHLLERHMYFWLGSVRKQGGPDRAATARLVERVGAFNPRVNRLANSTIRFAVDAATMSGMHDEARALITGFDPDESAQHLWVHHHALARSMAYARMALFDLVEAAAESKHGPVRQAAFQAPDIMGAWTEAEEQRLCPWAAKHLGKLDPQLNGGPGKLLLRCSDASKWRAMVLDEASRRLEAGTYKRPFAFVMDRACEPAVPGRQPAPGGLICERTEQLLRQIIQDERLSPRERAHALSALTKQFPNIRTRDFIKGLRVEDPVVTRRVDALLKVMDAAKQGAAAPATTPQEAPPTEGERQE